MLRKSKGHGLEYLDLAELVSLLVDAEHHLVYDPCLGPSHESAAVTLCEPSTASVKLRVSIKQNRWILASKDTVFSNIYFNAVIQQNNA